MIRRLSRRLTLKWLSSLAVPGIVPKREAVAQEAGDRLDRWHRVHDLPDWLVLARRAS